jgi:2'-5' RNA ligase
MKISNKAYIVAKIPAPVGDQIYRLREAYGYTLNLPVEITLAGSSGVGAIPIGTDLSLIRAEIDLISNQILPFEVTFNGWRTFPNTSIAYLSPSDRTIFDQIHERLIKSSIPFSSSDFEYTPHCTISTNLITTPDNITIPREIFIIDSISVFDLKEETLECRLLYETKLKAEPVAPHLR